jgi:selenoprotein W-related protein
MTDVEIEYCVPCGHLDNAEDVQHAILEEFGQEIDRVALKTGGGGVFEVRVDGELVFDKDEDEYSVDGIVERVREAHVQAA